MRALPTLLLAAAVCSLAACGDGEGGVRPAGPIQGRYVGQEIWITYKSKKYEKYGRRTGRSKGEAKRLAESLRRRVLAGEDVGALARKHSNAPGAAADGYSSELPKDPLHPDVRDRALAAAKVGEVTGIVDWFGGYWFAKRVDARKGLELRKRFERMMRERIQIRAIGILYVGADINDAFARDEVRRTHAQAVVKANRLLKQIQEGADFAELARLHTEDAPSAERGGLLMMVIKGQEATPWIRRGYLWIPASVLDAAFATPAGEVYPEVIDSERGVFLVKTEARKYVGGN